MRESHSYFCEKYPIIRSKNVIILSFSSTGGKERAKARDDGGTGVIGPKGKEDLARCQVPQKKSSGLCHKAAATAACRKLLVCIWGMLRSGAFFDKQFSKTPDSWKAFSNASFSVCEEKRNRQWHFYPSGFRISVEFATIADGLIRHSKKMFIAGRTPPSHQYWRVSNAPVV